MKIRTALSELLLAGTLVSGAAQANLIANGDFSLGNTGFSSQYTYMTATETIQGQGTYTVGTNPSAFHPAGPSFGDHTTGSGNMLMANGATTANMTVWQQTIQVAANIDYFFSGWAASWGNLGYGTDTSPAHLQFFVNGVQVGSEFVVDALNGLWTEFQFDFNSGSLTSLTLMIVDANLAAAPNDFSLDDISLDVAPTSVPEPSPLLLLAVGLTGLAFSTRQCRK